jgi:hypothetical protein
MNFPTTLIRQCSERGLNLNSAVRLKAVMVFQQQAAGLVRRTIPIYSKNACELFHNEADFAALTLGRWG